MIYAATRGEVETRRKAFIRKWRLKCRAVADSLEEAGDRLGLAGPQSKTRRVLPCPSKLTETQLVLLGAAAQRNGIRRTSARFFGCHRPSATALGAGAAGTSDRPARNVS